MLDINLIRTNPDLVRENIRKKFQDQKLPLVDEVIEMDKAYRKARQDADGLRNQRKTLSKQIGGLMAKGQKEEAEAVKAKVAALADDLENLEKQEEELEGKIRERMLVIPNIIDPSVPVGKDDSENVASPSCQTLRSPITWTSWSGSAESIWMLPARPAVPASITSWAISHGSTAPSCPTAVTL